MQRQQQRFLRNKKRGKQKNIDSQQAIIAREVQRALNTKFKPETKYYDVHLTTLPSDTVPAYQPLTDIPQGVAQSERIGDSIRVTNVTMSLNVTTANSDVFNLFRVVIFAWKENNFTVVPGSTSIVEDPVSFGVLSPLNYEGRKYYKVIRDHTYNLSGTAAAPTDSSQDFSVVSMKMNHEVVFSAGSTAGTGHLYYMHYSDSAITPFPTYSVHFRVWYTDM